MEPATSVSPKFKFDSLVKEKSTTDWQTACRIAENFIDKSGISFDQIQKGLKWAADTSKDENKLKGILAAIILRGKGNDTHLDQADKAEVESLISPPKLRKMNKEDRLTELLITINGLAGEIIAGPKLVRKKSVADRWKSQIEQTKNQAPIARKKLEGMEGVNVAERRKRLIELFKEKAKNTIKNNDVFRLAKNVFQRNQSNCDDLCNELERRANSMAPKIQKLVQQIEDALNAARQRSMKKGIAAVLKTEGCAITEDLQDGVQKYIFYLECMQIDNEKFAAELGKTMADYSHFEKADQVWRSGGSWPSYASEFRSWISRPAVPPKDVSEVKNIITEHSSKPDAVKVALQLCLNYWKDAYKVCSTLQNREEPNLKMLGHKMEKELWLAEQKSIIISESDSRDFNTRRLPQPEEVEKAKGR